jgi:hypothetical protein
MPNDVAGDLVGEGTIEESRQSPAGYVSDLKVRVSPVSVDAIVVCLTAVARGQ